MASVYERFGKTTLGGTTSSGRRYKIKGGDTLQSIAALMYPDEDYSSEAWRQLWEANLDQIDDLDNLQVGLVLVVPSLKASDT